MDSKEDIIYSCFKEQVTRVPNSIAVFDETTSLTYNQLDMLIDVIAENLSRNFSKVSDIKVGIIMDHDVYMIASIFAVLKLGGAYVPVEPDFPPERINFIMNECNIDFIITNKKYEHNFFKFSVFSIENIFKSLNSHEKLTYISDKDDNLYCSPSSLAYILYTSGSTGHPKGVCVENRNVCHYVRAFQNEFHVSNNDIMLQYSVCSFDIFTEEVFGTLLSGATLAIAPKTVKSDILKLISFIERYKITIISGFPYLMADLNKLQQIPSTIRLLISGGDVLRKRYITNLLKQTVIYNTYGPSETTVCASYFRCTPENVSDDGTYPIGKAILGTSIEILDDKLSPVSQGEVGEICIKGNGVSRGYTTSRENQNFVTMSDGSRIYKSGDLGYKLSDGNIAFIKRKDSQVMILGKRIEANEVENVLCNYIDVADGIVRPEIDTKGLSYLTAYVVPASEDFSLIKLKKHMEQYLAPFMIPEFFVLMDKFPLTANGKPNRRALPKVLKEGVI